MSGDVLRPITADDLVHLVFQLKFDFLQPMLFHSSSGVRCDLASKASTARDTRVLLGQPTELIVRLHQVRLQSSCVFSIRLLSPF